MAITPNQVEFNFDIANNKPVYNNLGEWHFYEPSTGDVSWDDITDKPTVIASGDTEADARDAIGAGTSDFSGSYNDLTDKPAVIAAGATAAAARTAIGLGTAATSAATAFATAAQGTKADSALQATYFAGLPGYDAGATQTLKNVSGVLTWVTDTP